MRIISTASHGKWQYTPADPQDLRMFSDEGPLSIAKKEQSNLLEIISNIKDDGLAVNGGRLVVGKKDGEYNDFIDMTFIKTPGKGVKIADHMPRSNEMVIALDLNKKTLVPAMMELKGGLRIELPEHANNTRYLIFLEDGSLLTASYEANGDYVRLIPRMALASWLLPLSGQGFRYAVFNDEGVTKITDSKTGNKYFIKGSVDEDVMDDMEYLANMHGLGVLISRYKLRRVKS